MNYNSEFVKKVRRGKPHPLLARSNFSENLFGFTEFLKAAAERAKKK